MKKEIGFTLAEVLITLTIIGVIAALTIPNLMQKWSDQADVAKVKEAYSILSNAFKMAIAENGPIDSWEWGDTTSKQKNVLFFAKELSKHLKIQKYCGKDNGCFSYGWQSDGGHSDTNAGYMKTLHNEISSSQLEGANIYKHAKMILSNGMIIGIDGSGSYNSESTGAILIDINGKSKPNRLGYDIFYFTILNNGLGFSGWHSNSNYCSIETTNSHNDGNRDGVACAYWIIKHGNMDYKYRDVSKEW